MTNEPEELAQLTDDQLDARLALFQALLKVAGEGKEAAMREADRRMREGGRVSNKRDVMVGSVACGYLTRSKDSVSVYDADEYGVWAADHGHGKKYLQIDVTGNQELLDVLTEWCGENDAAYRVTGKADAAVKKTLALRDGRVLSWDGEVVPGAGVRAGSLTYRDCKPQEVAAVLRNLGEDMSVAGFLGTGE